MFPKARYHIQDLEMQFCTGRYMTHAHMPLPFAAEDVVAMVRHLYDGRVVFHSGDERSRPGLSLHHVGGHSMGLQMVRVRTRRGWVVLAADAAHYYANMERELAYPFTFNIGEVLEGYRRARALADSPGHIIPGHDPLVLQRYPASASATLKAGWRVLISAGKTALPFPRTPPAGEVDCARHHHGGDAALLHRSSNAGGAVPHHFERHWTHRIRSTPTL